MRPLDKLHSVGQSLWLDHVSREQISNGTLIQYADDGTITGIAFSMQAISHSLSMSTVYDGAIRAKLNEDLYGEPLVYDLVLEDIHRAADILQHVFDLTEGVDGWVAFPVSPLLASAPDTLLESVSVVHGRLKRENVLITVPGLPDLLGAIEEMVYAGIPINISLIYTSNQYLGVAEAYLRGINRRVSAGLKPAVSAFISTPLAHLATQLSKEMNQQETSRATLAIARKIYATMRGLHTSLPWERVYNLGARPLRLIWVSSDETPAPVSRISLYDSLIAPFTVALMTEQIITDFFRYGHPPDPMPMDGGDCEQVLTDLYKAGFDLENLADILQEKVVESQVKEWFTILDAVARKSTEIIQMGTPVKLV